MPTLTSKGGTVLYSVDGDTLTGYGERWRCRLPGRNGPGRLHPTKIDSGGHYKFTLLDQIDHLPNSPADDDAQTLPILDFSSAIKFTDFDGNSITLSGGFNISVEDDIPVLTSATISRIVDEDDIKTNWSHETFRMTAMLSTAR